MHFVENLSGKGTRRGAHGRWRMDRRTLLVERVERSRWRRFFALQCLLDQRANFIVLSISGYRVVTLQHAAGVGVDHEDRVVSRIKKNGVGRLGADAFLRQQFLPQLLGGCREHGVKRSPMVLVQERNETLQTQRLLAKVSR